MLPPQGSVCAGAPRVVLLSTGCCGKVPAAASELRQWQLWVPGGAGSAEPSLLPGAPAVWEQHLLVA